MNRREFIYKGLIVTACTALPGCGSSRPSGFNSGYISTLARAQYIPQPIPDFTTEDTPSRRQSIEIYRRGVWNKTTPSRNRMKRMDKIHRITIHHEGNPHAFTDTDPRSIADELRKIQSAHRMRMRAGDIGYHFIIDPAGKVWEGRSIGYTGAHVRSHNSGNLGIMVLGNFEIQHPTPEQIQTLDAFIGVMRVKYDIPISAVRAHRDLANTACPGENLYGRITELASLNHTETFDPEPVKSPHITPPATRVPSPVGKPASKNEASKPTRSLF